MKKTMLCITRKRPRGMTIVELSITVVILASLTSIAIPGILGGIHRRGVDGAARRLAEDIRLAQSSAITRGMQVRLVAFDQTGTAPSSGWTTDPSKANLYRIEMRAGAAAVWPDPTDTPGSNANVLTPWKDLSGYYRGVSVTAGNTVTFNSQGFLSGSGTPLNIAITVTGPGGTKTVQTNPIGKATIS
jgi:prepilin-type N-terminal cleavage/methylation domain-containing protein